MLKLFVSLFVFAAVLFGASGVKAFDGGTGIVSYKWYLGGVLVATGVKPTLKVKPGVYTFTLVVADIDGATASDDVVVTVKYVKASKKSR